MEFFDVVIGGGGQSGPAAAHALRRRGLRPVVLEASGQATGSWPHCYDGLSLFSPAGYSSLPGLSFGGDPGSYPHRDEVVAHLVRHADQLDAEIRTGRRVRSVRRDGEGFGVTLDGGRQPGREASSPQGVSVSPAGLTCPAWTPSPARCCTPRTAALPNRSPGSASS